MKHQIILIIFSQLIIFVSMQKKKPSPLVERPVESKIDNPNFIRDRKRLIIQKPEMPMTWANRFRAKFDPSWMDYCNPYHCNSYHTTACGLNRRTMKFKYFQSVCHLILNNQCSNYRGFLKFDLIEIKYCRAFVMFLRAGCPATSSCDKEVDPVCAMSSVDGHVVLFKNRCFMDAVNCNKKTLQEYDEVYMHTCQLKLVARTENNAEQDIKIID